MINTRLFNLFYEFYFNVAICDRFLFKIDPFYIWFSYFLLDYIKLFTFNVLSHLRIYRIHIMKRVIPHELATLD